MLRGRLSSRAVRGRLFTIEGMDGAGKTTLAGALQDALQRRGRDVRLLREPRGVEASERIRDSSRTGPADRPASRGAPVRGARAQLVEEARAAAAERGVLVAVDGSSTPRSLTRARAVNLGLEAVRAIIRFATGDLDPDRTLLLQIDPELARARFPRSPGGTGRLEGEADDSSAELDHAYRSWPRRPRPIRIIDAGQPPSRCSRRPWGARRARLTPPSAMRAQRSAAGCRRVDLRGRPASATMSAQLRLARRPPVPVGSGRSPTRAAGDRPSAVAPRSGDLAPVTCSAVAITSRTEKPLPLPRLKIRCSRSRAPSRARMRAAARSSIGCSRGSPSRPASGSRCRRPRRRAGPRWRLAGHVRDQVVLGS